MQKTSSRRVLAVGGRPRGRRNKLEVMERPVGQRGDRGRTKKHFMSVLPRMLSERRERGVHRQRSRQHSAICSGLLSYLLLLLLPDYYSYSHRHYLHRPQRVGSISQSITTISTITTILHTHHHNHFIIYHNHHHCHHHRFHLHRLVVISSSTTAD